MTELLCLKEQTKAEQFHCDVAPSPGTERGREAVQRETSALPKGSCGRLVLSMTEALGGGRLSNSKG